MMEQLPFIIYKSSAGSGKTYTLTMEYLKLALRFPPAFKSILAVTFTNKATQEMKERILKELMRLRNTVKPAEKMDSEILSALNVDAEELKSRATQTLTAILHDYSRFSVSTIDSFFQRVVRAFAREMDLNAKFEVELDQDAVLERVVDRIVEKVIEDAHLHKWLVDYATDQIQNGKSWDIRKNIKGLGRQIFQEDFKRNATEIRIFLEEKENLKTLSAFIRQRKKKLLDEAKQINLSANQIRKRLGLEWEDYYRGFTKKFDKLGSLECPMSDFTDNQKLMAIAPQGWATQKSSKRNLIEQSYHAGLGGLLGKIEPLEYQWNTIEAIGKNFYVYGIFRNLLDELTTIKDEENMLLISDANEFLKEITKENDAPFIYEKVGSQYKHYLIDEFQDTSGFQWSSFKPLLENSLAQGNTNLLVGDVKQSIYRWRGGEMKLLLEQVEAETGMFGINLQNLDTNFRSLPQIINFNNALFARLPHRFQEVIQSQYGIEGVDVIEKAYKDVYQHVSLKKKEAHFKGKVKIEFLEEQKEEEDGKFQQQVLEKLPRMVMDLQDQGYAPRDIAFLVRRKSEGEAIADTLMSFATDNPGGKYCFDVLSDESMYLSKSASVKALVAALKYLQNQEDQVQFKTMWYYRAQLLGLEVNHQLFELGSFPSHMAEIVANFQSKEMQLLQLPLMEVVEEIIGILGLMENGQERAYTSGFKEAVYDFMANNRADLAGFLDWWEDNQNKRTVKIPEGHNAMRILTIHKSKGLQFKVVLMPFLTWTIFDTAKDNVIWSPFEDEESGLSAIIPLTLRKELAKSEFHNTYGEECILAYLDTLNMIYVALTRAEEVFWALAPYKPDKKDRSLNNIEVNIQQVFEYSHASDGELDLSIFFDPSTHTFDLGEWPKYDQVEVEKNPLPELRWQYQNWTKLLQVKKYAVGFSEEGLAQRRKRNFGLLVHEILEKAVSLNEAKEILQAFYFEGRLSETEKSAVELQLDELFTKPLFNSWFAGEGSLLAEQGILLPGGKQKRPDKIILGDNEAVIVDFKTGEEYERYEKQIKEYMELVSSLTKKPVSGYLCYLESGRILEVV